MRRTVSVLVILALLVTACGASSARVDAYFDELVYWTLVDSDTPYQSVLLMEDGPVIVKEEHVLAWIEEALTYPQEWGRAGLMFVYTDEKDRAEVNIQTVESSRRAVEVCGFQQDALEGCAREAADLFDDLGRFGCGVVVVQWGFILDLRGDAVELTASPEFITVMNHEVGHCLGLPDQDDDPEELMYHEYFSGELKVPSEREIAFVRERYDIEMPAGE